MFFNADSWQPLKTAAFGIGTLKEKKQSMNIVGYWFLISIVGIFIESRLPESVRDNFFVCAFFAAVCLPVLAVICAVLCFTFLLALVSKDSESMELDCCDGQDDEKEDRPR